MKEQEFALVELQVWLCPSWAVAVAMYMSTPETGDQDTVLAPHSVETETLLGEQGPGEMEGSGEKQTLFFSSNGKLVVSAD